MIYHYLTPKTEDRPAMARLKVEEPVALPCQMPGTKLAKGSIPCMLHTKNLTEKTQFIA